MLINISTLAGLAFILNETYFITNKISLSICHVKEFPEEGGLLETWKSAILDGTMCWTRIERIQNIGVWALMRMVRKQDYFSLLFYYLGYSTISSMISRIKRKPVTRFVTFHDTPPKALGFFEDKLDFLCRQTNVVSMDDFFRGRLSSKKLNVVITFDDGYKNWASHAVQFLKKFKLPATFFVSSAFAGLSSDKESGPARSQSPLKREPNRGNAGLSVEDLRRIDDLGFTIGGHTLSHCNLSEIKNSAKIKSEISEDKNRLEKTIGKKIEYFAYPSGICRNPWIDLIDVLEESGYKGAVTTASGPNSIATNPYLLHRELTDASMPMYVFKARLYGNYDPVRFIRRYAQRLAGKITSLDAKTS